MSKKRKKKFYEKPDCTYCKKAGYVGCYECEDRVWKCKKRYKGIKLISSILAILLIYTVFHKALYITGKPIFSVWLMAATMALLDILFVGTGKVITKFFGYLEQKSIEKQEKIKQDEIEKEEAKEKEIEAEKQRIKEEEAGNVGKVRELLERFKQISENEGEQDTSSKFSTKEYEAFVETLSEVCDLLKPEHFKELEIRNLFEMLLPEFLTICERFEKRYEEYLLDSKEREGFTNLIKSFGDKMIEVCNYLKAGENVSLRVRIETLYSFVKSEGSEQ